MKNKPNPDRSFIYFILRAQQLAKQDARSDKGYAMMIVSIITIAMFSLLAVYMTMTNLTKSSTNAYIDGTNTFYAAESGLNRRADRLRQKFVGYATPTGTVTNTAASLLSTCTPVAVGAAINPADDFECQNYSFTYNNNIAQVTSGGNTVLSEQDGGRNRINYTAYTFVRPERDYSTTPPSSRVIPAGQTYAGLNALEYRYTIYATAAKPDPNSATRAIQQTGGQTVLQMDFRSRIVPLFQFAAFYEDDLEINSFTKMTISGPAHTNGNLKAASLNTLSEGDFTQGVRFMDNVTVVMDVYNDTPYPNTCTTCRVSVYDGTGDNTLIASYGLFPNPPNRTTPLTTTQLGMFGTRLKTRVPRLNVPAPGFLREKNYKTGETGLYYGKADLRLKFFPTRAMPFDLTSIQTGSGCSLTAFNIPSDRQSSSALTCSRLTKGQLQSLRQPVLTRSTSATALSAKNQAILKALQVAIASSSTLVTLSDLETPINTASGWGKTFKDLLTALPPTTITSTEISNLLPTGSTSTFVGWPSPSRSPSPAWSSSPPSPSPSASCTVDASPPTTGNAKDIVRSLCSTFLAAPIQQITGNTTSPDSTSASTDRKVNVGFYDQNTTTSGAFDIANGEWMQMLQLNIESLTYWNRDGISVEPVDSTLITAYATPTGLTIASGLSTENVAFKKAAADTSKPVGSFAEQGLAANDTTEGGLVFHATVSDDLNGDGTNDTTATVANKVPGKDNNGVVISHVDNYRIYPTASAIRKSPYGFVLSGGVELPGPLTIATDQPAYIQGDYNNPGVAPGTLPQGTFYYPSDVASDDRGFRRQPAAIMADTLTFLSNGCLNDNRQVNCGNNTSVNSRSVVTNGIAINAALLSNIMKSTSSATFNGGLNKYMKHLEDWGNAAGATLNYTGSMISLGEPLESDKISANSNVYRRNYNYETRFNSADKLPPLTPRAIYLQQDVFKRNY
jgi:Tfp pilus assembly protein PilX